MLPFFYKLEEQQHFSTWMGMSHYLLRSKMLLGRGIDLGISHNYKRRNSINFHTHTHTHTYTLTYGL
jgi:uncharacterized HAD superfamily protein